jgi:hypothetical protein
VPFVTTPERVGIRRGLRRAIEILLRARFGEPGVSLMTQVNGIHNAEQLLAIVELLATAIRLEEVSKACAEATEPPPAPKTKSRRGKRT